MAVILNLETATKTCSVALAVDNEIKAVQEITTDNYSHAEKLNIFIQDVLQNAQIKMSDIDAVAVSAGPGSYTGLRIGTSTAKGICYALRIPLIAVDSLAALANLVKQPKYLVCPMFDARRMEVYEALFDENLKNITSTKATVLDKDSYADYLKNEKIIFCGPGAAKFKAVVSSNNAIFDTDTHISAKGMVDLSLAKYSNAEFENVAYFEPAYLKDFVAGKPKKLI